MIIEPCCQMEGPATTANSTLNVNIIAASTYADDAGCILFIHTDQHKLPTGLNLKPAVKLLSHLPTCQLCTHSTAM